MWESGERFRAVKAAEIELLDGAARRDVARVGHLLHADFVEIGRSGRRWNRDETIAALAGEQGRVEPTTDEWLFNEIAPGVVLVTYRLATPTVRSRHSSIWDTSGQAPVLRYHQGTVIPVDGK